MNPFDTESVCYNRLIESLRGIASDRFFSSLQLISLENGNVLYESDASIRYAYFPTTSVVSLIYLMENGATNEIAVVNNEGIVGVPLYMGPDPTPSRAVVRCAGAALRVRGSLLLEEFNRSAEVQRVLLGYTQSLLAQISQTAACNRHHSLPQQLCRWLLVSTDSLHSDHLVTTHEGIASMLGVRRESITKEAGELQNAGLIHYSRGHITVLDRDGLKKRACECYRAGKRQASQPQAPQFVPPPAPASTGIRPLGDHVTRAERGNDGLGLAPQQRHRHGAALIFN